MDREVNSDTGGKTAYECENIVNPCDTRLGPPSLPLQRTPEACVTHYRWEYHVCFNLEVWMVMLNYLHTHHLPTYPHFIDKYSLAIHWSTQIHTHTDLFQEGNIHHVLLIHPSIHHVLLKHPSIHLLCPTQPLIHPIFLPMKVFTCRSPCTQVTHIHTLIFIHTFCSKKNPNHLLDSLFLSLPILSPILSVSNPRLVFPSRQ